MSIPTDPVRGLFGGGTIVLLWVLGILVLIGLVLGIVTLAIHRLASSKAPLPPAKLVHSEHPLGVVHHES